jgi:hypothetical protein
MLTLSDAEKNLLQALANGHTLKSHRYIDGAKVYQLHSLDGSIEDVSRETVQVLQDHRLIDSNKKFPAATYWLTDAGHQWLNRQANRSA